MDTLEQRKWPLLVKAGSITVKVYETVDRGRRRYTVSYHEGGIRRLRQFAELPQAKAEAKLIADRLNAGKGDALHLTGKDRDAYLYALRKLKNLDVPLVAAIDEFVEAKKIGVPLLLAAKLYQEQNHASLPSKSVEEVFNEFMAAKKADGRSVRYLQDCKARLGRFAKGFRCEIKSIRTADIDAWLRALQLSPRSRNNFRTVVCSLFSFARAAGYLPKGETEAESVSIANERGGEIAVFSPEEFAALLAGTRNPDEPEFSGLLPFLVFGGFCGMRSAEVLRLTWERVNWAEDCVEVSAGTAKTGTRRLAPFPKAAKAWLAGHKNAKGPVVRAESKLYCRLGRLASAAGFEWRQNALRHSFCSYRLAILKDPIRVSYEAGNSPQIIRSHYDRVVTEGKGKAWFGILPIRPKNVVEMKEAA